MLYDDMAKYHEWAIGDDAGTSSKTLVQATSGAIIIAKNSYSAPSDTSDIGRCFRALDRFPELKPGIRAVEPYSPSWPALVAHWDELDALYRAIDCQEHDYVRRSAALYNKMNELRGWPEWSLPKVTWDKGSLGHWRGWYGTRIARQNGKGFTVWKRTRQGDVEMGRAKTLAEAAIIAAGE